MANTSIGSTALYISADDSKFQAGLGRAEKRLAEFKVRIVNDSRAIQQQVTKSFDFTSLLKIGGPLAAGAGGLFAGISLAGLVKDSIQLAASVEDTKTEFRVLLGDAGKASELFKDIRDFAAATPLGLADLTTAAKTLLGFGVDDSQIVATLRALGDLAGGSAEKLKALSVVYGQVRAAGKLNGQDLNQFISNNVSLLEPLAKVLHISTAEVKQFIEEGKVGFPDVQRAIIAMTGEGGKFFGLMAEKGKTLTGLLSTLKDSWEQLLGNVGQVLIEEFGLKDFVGNLSQALDLASDNVEGIRPTVHEIAKVAKDIGADLLKGGVAFAVAIGEARDTLGEFRADWTVMKVAAGSALNFNIPTNREQLAALLNPQQTFIANALAPPGEGGPGGRAGSWEAKIKEFADKLTNIFNKGGADAGLSFGKSFAEIMAGIVLKDFKKVTQQLKVEADKLRADDLKKVTELRDQFNPAGKAARELADLRRIQALGGFANDAGLFEFARQRIFDQLIRPEPVRNSGAAAAGTAEAVGAIIASRTSAMGAGNVDPVVNKLEQQRELQSRTLIAIEKLKDVLEALNVPGVF